MLSEPWLAIHNLACLSRAYEEGARERGPREERGREDLRRGGGGGEDEEGEDEDEESYIHQPWMEERRESMVHRRDNRYGGEHYNSCQDFFPRVSQSVLSLTESSSSQVTWSRLVPKRCLTPGGSTLAQKSSQLPACPSPHSQLRRNTLPSVTVVPPLLHLPPLVHQSDSHPQVPTKGSLTKSSSMVFLPHPPSSSPPSPSSRASVRPALLPPLPLSLSVTSLAAPPASCCGERSRRSLRRHSVQLDQIRGREQHMGI